MLIEDNLIEKTKRKKKGTNEYLTNLYQILLPQRVANKRKQPSVSDDTTPSEPNLPITIPNINYTNLTNNSPVGEPEIILPVFSFKEEMQKLIDSSWKPNKIIYLYFLRKKFNFENMTQFKAEVGRSLRPAKELEGYRSSQIEQTMDMLENAGLTWSLNAVARNISNVVNRK
jgi:hypothetical protein